jgi:hypothetical protein
LSRVLYFTMVTHLPDRSLDQIFKALKDIFYYYLQRGFHMTFIMVHKSVDGSALVELDKCKQTRAFH